jgi:hypothetical protein
MNQLATALEDTIIMFLTRRYDKENIVSINHFAIFPQRQATLSIPTRLQNDKHINVTLNLVVSDKSFRRKIR